MRSATSTLRLVLPPFVAGKLVALLVPVLTVWSTSSTHGIPGYAELVRPFGSWDGENYRQIAEYGYPSGPLDLTPGEPGHLWGFFPGYALLLRFALFFFRDDITAGIVVSSACTLVALVYLAKLVQLERGDSDSAQFSAWLLMLYPYAVFLTALYTESAFLAAATASLYYMRRGDNGRASIAAAVAIAVRITGLALIPALLIEHLRRRHWRPDIGLVYIAASLLPLLGFMWYAQHLTGDAFAYQHVQQSASYGNRVTTWPWLGLWHTWQVATSGGPGRETYIFMMEVIFGVSGFVMLVLLALDWKRIAPSLTLFAAGVWVLGASLTYWLGMPRYEMTMVPIYIYLANITQRRPQLRLPILIVSCGWMAFVASMLGTGRYTG
jgi:hypothetical protein